MKWLSADRIVVAPLAPRFVAGAVGAALVLVATPAAAQSNSRLERIEAQLSALQRAVFPGGDERFFEPEITPEARTTNPQQPLPQVNTSALTDVLARLDAIETQLARLTAATEVNENALSSLETRLVALESGASANPPLAAAATPAPTPAPTGTIPVPGGNAALPAPPPQPQQAAPTPARVAAVQAIAKPATGDQGEDEYTYGFRLWDAGFYPEAQQQLALFIERYPGHRMISFGRNLLGRAFLDAGDPRTAATHFFENYQSDGQGARAADSLLYLAESMIALNDTRRACIALAEFGEGYPALATGRLQGQYATLTGRVDCD
ncbi:MAG: tetratricopeptide repeat protein [Erythrobacter sp.]|nr:MAG: tetratricopeptide repeat protein [Erythrobacter sp.]